jgi:hypothetical protein
MPRQEEQMKDHFINRTTGLQRLQTAMEQA